MSGAVLDTCTAGGAETLIDMRHKIFDCHSLQRAYTRTFATADARHFTLFHCHAALIVVAAGYIYQRHTPRHELHQVARTGVNATSATNAFVEVHNRQTYNIIHMQGIIRAGRHTIAAAKTSVGAGCGAG